MLITCYNNLNFTCESFGQKCRFVLINLIITCRVVLITVGGREFENRGKWERFDVKRIDLKRHWRQGLGKNINNSSQALGDYNAQGPRGY